MNTNRMNILDLAIDERDLEIREDELVSITNAGLKKVDAIKKCKAIGSGTALCSSDPRRQVGSCSRSLLTT